MGSWKAWVLLALAWISCPTRADFFVDPTGGNDLADGSRRAPFATLERARTAVREWKTAGRLPPGGLTVWLAPADFGRTHTFELTAADSGTVASPVVWRGSSPGETRLLGGRAAAWAVLEDPAVLERLDLSARGRVLVADVRDWGLPAEGGLVSRGFGRATSVAHCELFHAGRPMIVARWPNEGTFETLAGFPETSGKGDDHGGKIGALDQGFYYSGDRPARWKDVSQLWVHGYWAWDWANSYERVASLDLARRWIRTSPPHGLYGFRKGQRFYFLNVLEELDQPGEWYLDAVAGKVYFWPPGSDAETRVVNGTIGGRETLLSRLGGPLLRIRGASNVVFRAMTFEATRGQGLEIRDSVDVRIEDCVVRNVGNAGIDVVGGLRVVVAGCDVLDTGDGGVNLSGGDRATLRAAGHRVESCLFERQGRWSKCYVPAVLLQGVGMSVVGNLIRDHPHCAILFGGNEHLMEFNEIHHVALETGDVGALYTGRDYSYRGNRIRHNYIHHVGGVGMGSMGAYMDDCVSGTEIAGNVFYKVQRAAFLGGGRDHRVVNNLFVDCRHAVELDGRGLDRAPVWRDMVDKTMRQRLNDVPLARYRERYPELRGLDASYGVPGGNPIVGDDFRGVPPENNLVARNVCVGDWLRVGWHAKVEMLRLEDNLTGADPGFVGTIGDDARPTDFELREDSPAWKLGFERIPLERIGLQRAVAGRRGLEGGR